MGIHISCPCTSLSNESFEWEYSYSLTLIVMLTKRLKMLVCGALFLRKSCWCPVTCPSSKTSVAWKKIVTISHPAMAAINEGGICSLVN